MKTCPVPGCDHSIDDRLIMCGAHWTRVPGWLQSKLSRARKKAFTGDAAADARAVELYMKAKAQAIRSVSPRGRCRTDLRALEAAL